MEIGIPLKKHLQITMFFYLLKYEKIIDWCQRLNDVDIYLTINAATQWFSTLSEHLNHLGSL